jgi:hypothetical protein
MSLVHIVMTRVTGYDNFTLHFDDRSEKDFQGENPFSYFEREFVKALSNASSHPEYTYNVRYYGYMIFPKIDAMSIYKI